MFPYTSKEKYEKKIKRTISFTVTSKRTKYSGISLTKEVEDLDTKNYEMKTQINEKITCVHGLLRLNIVKMLKPAICDNINRHYAKWNKLSTERKTFPDVTYMRYLQ